VLHGEALLAGRSPRRAAAGDRQIPGCRVVGDEEIEPGRRP
jgi:hypothetical protein